MLSRPTVCLFRASLDLDAGLLTALSATLSPEELARARAMRTARLRARLIADLGWRRRLLAQRLGTSPEAVRFRRSERGKPHLVGGGPHFSASRSEDVAWYAVCEEAPVGVDVQRVDADRPLEALARRLLTARERAVYDALPAQRRARALTACWACKEAAGKALGAGLVFPATALEAWSREGAPLRTGGLEIHQLPAGEGRSAAVAVRVTGEEVVQIEPVRELVAT
ncbi:MAG TPA: 4'-phosphopantetheinyl transferase superfamily protein [Solirubrobacteraceae bacterium]|nr:4'-phosphopantetheinyl transferase superfamily protein [Solirubrobacteraceae bacterium]